jgi:hypothetical protein
MVCLYGLRFSESHRFGLSPMYRGADVLRVKRVLTAEKHATSGLGHLEALDFTVLEKRRPSDGVVLMTFLSYTSLIQVASDETQRRRR